MPVPKISAATVSSNFLVFQYINPQHSAPIILPGNAIRLPSPNRFRSRLARNAHATP